MLLFTNALLNIFFFSYLWAATKKGERFTLKINSTKTHPPSGRRLQPYHRKTRNKDPVVYSHPCTGAFQGCWCFKVFSEMLWNKRLFLGASLQHMHVNLSTFWPHHKIKALQEADERQLVDAGSCCGTGEKLVEVQICLDCWVDPMKADRRLCAPPGKQPIYLSELKIIITINKVLACIFPYAHTE